MRTKEEIEQKMEYFKKVLDSDEDLGVVVSVAEKLGKKGIEEEIRKRIEREIKDLIEILEWVLGGEEKECLGKELSRNPKLVKKYQKATSRK